MSKYIGAMPDAKGPDYPGTSQQHSYLKDLGRVEYKTVDDEECLDAFRQLSQLEGIIPAMESAHAVAHTVKIVPEMASGQSILINLSGRGSKDVDFVADYLRL